MDVKHDFGEDIPFVGRDNDFTAVDAEWTENECRIYEVFGIRAVGKSRFVSEFLRRKKTSVLHVDLSSTVNVDVLYNVLITSLHVPPISGASDTRKWMPHVIAELIKFSSTRDVTLFLDNAEDALESSWKDELLSLCCRTVKSCPRLKLCITSTKRVHFSELGKVFRCFELQPLRLTDAKQLLHVVTRGIDLGGYGNAIAELSEGLPLLILLVGEELRKGLYGQKNAISPETVVQLLLNSRLKQFSGGCLQDEENIVGTVYRKFLLRLSDVYREYMSTLNYIPGSFTARQAGDMLECETEAMAKLTAIRPIRVQSMLNYKHTVKRFNIQGIIREVIRAHFVIKDLAAVRKKYCRTFTAVMKEICKKMGTAAYTEAMSDFALEQPNLHKLLGEVQHTQQDTYPFFIEMAGSCTDLIEVYMAKDGEKFYQGCLDLAERYGKVEDKATVYMAVGSMETLTKGDLLTGATNYQLALKEIERKGQSVQLASLYQKLGWNIFKQGDIRAAIELYKKSLALSQHAGEDYVALKLQALGYIGVAEVVLGNYGVAARYHTHCLRSSKDVHGNIHPKVGNALNRLGLLYDQQGDVERGLEYFRESLSVKKKSDAPPISIVYSLSNVANSYKSLGDYEKAHELVDEAFEILKGQKINMLDGFSLMYNTRGKIFAKQGKYKEATEAFRKTVDITRQVERKSYIYMKRLVNLAEVLEKRKMFKSCLEYAEEALSIKDETNKALPHNTIVIECLQCIVKTYEHFGLDDQCKDALFGIERECYRLEKVCTEQYNASKLVTIETTMKELHEKFSKLTVCNKNDN